MTKLTALFLFAILHFNLQAIEVGKPPPAWSFTDIDGNVFNQSNTLGKVVFVRFCVSWCVPCTWEIPAMIELNNKYKPAGLVFIAIVVRQSRSEIETYRDTHGINYPLIMSSEQVLWDWGFFPTGGFAYTVIVDRDNIVAAKYMFYHTKAFQEAIIQPLIIDRPKLEARLKEDEPPKAMLLSWSGRKTNYFLESRALAGTNWVKRSEAPNLEEGRWEAMVPLVGWNTIFRLKSTSEVVPSFQPVRMPFLAKKKPKNPRKLVAPKYRDL